MHTLHIANKIISCFLLYRLGKKYFFLIKFLHLLNAVVISGVVIKTPEGIHTEDVLRFWIKNPRRYMAYTAIYPPLLPCSWLNFHWKVSLSTSWRTSSISVEIRKKKKSKIKYLSYDYWLYSVITLDVYDFFLLFWEG